MFLFFFDHLHTGHVLVYGENSACGLQVMNNLKMEVITMPTCKRQHDGSEHWRFTGIIVARGCSVSSIAKDQFYLVTNMSTTEHGDDKLYVNIGPKSKVLHVGHLR